MNLQLLYSYTRKAIDTFHMIEENDKIAIGISGGKDSLTLLYALAGLRRFYPKKFDLYAVTVNLGFPTTEQGISFQEGFKPIKQLCADLDVHYTIVDTQIYDIVFTERAEKNPCSLCAKMRKGALNDAMNQLGINKIAYAHHKDDIIETLMMSLIFEGRIHTFAPVTYLDRTDLTVIRPLIYVTEQDVISFKDSYKLPVFKSPCPANGYTKREYAKKLISDIQNESNTAKNCMFTAILKSNIKGYEDIHP